MKKNKNYIYQTGFSIIELLIALSISTVLMLGVGIIFQTSKTTYRAQEALSDISDNARFAFYYLEQDIASAGFWGCNSNASNNGSGVKTVINSLNAGTPTSINFALGSGIAGTDGPPVAPPDAADTIIIQGLFAQPMPATIDANQNDRLTVANPVTLANGTLLAISNCQEVEIFQNTAAVTNGTVIPHAAGPTATGPGNQSNNFAGNTFSGLLASSQAHLYQANQVIYTVRPGPAPRNRPSLYRIVNGPVPPPAPGVPAGTQPLLEGVTDIQFTYGEDTNGDGNANRFLIAGAAGQNMANVVAVRVTLTFDSNRIGVVQGNAQIASDTSGQRRLNRTLTQTYALRNRIPITAAAAVLPAPPAPGP